jgi:hypothetical protein
VSAGEVNLGFLIGRRVEQVIRLAVDAMPDDVRAAGVAWYEQTGQEPGVVAYPSDAGIDLHWGGQRLAFIDADALTEDALLFGTIDGTAVAPE